MSCTIHALKKAVLLKGGTITGGRNGRYTKYDIESPKGFLWAATGDIHTMCVMWWHSDKRDKQDAIADAIERVSEGLCECATPNCSICEGKDEHGKIAPYR
jgi:hypothetical protein